MRAMNYDCCLHFCGEGHTIEDFHEVMTRLVCREDSQYSYRNTLCAMKGDEVVGIIVCYDGGRLKELRQPFLDEALQSWGRDLSAIADETGPGELYIDSLCVKQGHEGQGIATSLILKAAERARREGLRLGLLVDVDNPKAEALYLRAGFHQEGTTTWGGHGMKHLVME